MTDEIAVANSDDQPKAEPEDKNAQTDDLDSILAEYDQDTQEPKPEPKDTPKSSDRLEKALSYIERQERESQDVAYRSTMVEAIKEIKGEDIDLDDEFLEGWLNLRAQRDSRLTRAYTDRKSNPTGWNRALKGLRNEVQKKFAEKLDREATSDSEAIASSVRSATSTKGGERKTYSKAEMANMSDADFFAAYEKGDLHPQE